MKQRIILLLKVILIYNISNGQSRKFEIIYLAKYKYTHQKDAKVKSSKVLDYMNLEIGKNQTLYYCSQRQIGYNKSLEDKINQTPLESIMKNTGSYFLDAESEIIEYNLKNKSFQIFDKLSSLSEYKCFDTLGLPIWNLLEDTMTLIGQECQKASTRFRGRNYVAWFATKIPISVGPYKFVGLPGLVLKINSDNDQFIFECIGLTQNITKEPVFRLYNHCKKVTYKNLKDLQKLKIENRKLFMQMEYPNISVTRSDGKSNDNENKKTVLAPYNPIDLSP